MADSEDVNTLKRRGRRRLVGAIALVLLAVIVLPMVFDSEPKGSAPQVSVRIPGEDESGFVPKVTPKGPSQESKAPVPEKPAPVPEKTAEKAPEKAAEKVAEAPAEKAAPAPETPAAPAKAPEPSAQKIEVTVKKGGEAPAPAASATGEQFMVPAGAYTDPAAVIAKLKSARVPYYTEPIATKQGTVIRVRAGPFASRDAAEKTLKKLKDLGLKPGNVAAKS